VSGGSDEKKTLTPEQRRSVVAAIRRGDSQRQVAREFGVPVSTVQHWLRRASGRRLDRVDWESQTSTPRRKAKTSREMEDKVLAVRKELREFSILGEYGAQAIYDELKLQGATSVPSIRTIGRILKRGGVLYGRGRSRRRAPSRGWYLIDLAAKQTELDSFDVVQGLVIRGGIDVEVLNGISLHGRLVASWPLPAITAKITVEKLTEHWRQWGLPGYVQFDNDTRFQGAHQHKDSFSRVVRLCLGLGVVPVFAPPREYGFQASVESYNGLWQTKVWSRYEHKQLTQLQERSDRYVTAHRARTERKRGHSPSRRTFPADWSLDLQAPLCGRVVFLRRTDQAGSVFFLGRRYVVCSQWLHRLVRCEIDLDRHQITFFALRRSKPDTHDLINTAAYNPPRRTFIE